VTGKANLKLITLVMVLLITRCTKERKPEEQKKPANSQISEGEVLVPASQQIGIIESRPIQPSELPEIIRVPGKVTLPDNGSWRVGAITNGKVEDVEVSQGDYVRKGHILARMHSHDVHEVKAEYLTAVAERSRLQSAEAVARKNYERTQRLYNLKAASLEQTELAHQQWIDAQTALHNGEVAVQRERAHLEDSLGISASSAENPASGDELIVIRAPGSGYVLQKNVTPGTVVAPSTDLFLIGEIKHLWVTASVREEYLGKLKVGQKVNIAINDVPGVKGEGRLTHVGEEFDPTTHTMRVRVEFENPKNLFRPEMLVQAEIPVGNAKPMLLVPGDAVQQINGQDVVFVRVATDKFAMRPVRTAPQVGTGIPILEGLKPGEQVVIRGSFILKSEMLKSAMESE
jgi:membrane fusion protein, heavy metal efflux system